VLKKEIDVLIITGVDGGRMWKRKGREHYKGGRGKIIEMT